MSLTTAVALTVKATLSKTVNLTTPSDALSYAIAATLATGTGSGNADVLWHDTRTLTATSNETLDLTGSLTDALGSTVSQARVKCILIYNKATVNGDTLTVGAAASNAWAGWTSVSTSTIKVGPGGFAVLYDPSATAMAVTAGTGDQLKVLNNSGSNSVTYDIVVVGCSV